MLPSLPSRGHAAAFLAAVLLLSLLCVHTSAVDATTAAEVQLLERQHELKPPTFSSGVAWSSRRSLQQQLPTPPLQPSDEASGGSDKAPPPSTQQPARPVGDPKATSNGTAPATAEQTQPQPPPASDAPTVPPPSPPAEPPFNQRRTLQLPPHVYLISFVMLLAIMAGLLTCHCYRMCRIARRMRRAAELGVTISAAGAMLSKRTPQSVIESLPVSKYSSLQTQRQTAALPAPSKAADAGKAASTANGVSTAEGTTVMNPFVAAAMQLRGQFAGIGSRSLNRTSLTAQPAAETGDTPADPATSRQMQRSSSSNSAPAWRTSLSFGRRNAQATSEITAATTTEEASKDSAPAVDDISADVVTASVRDQLSPPAAAAAVGESIKLQLAAGKSSSSGAEPCAICFEDFTADDDVKQLPCKHFFHVGCIDEWLVRDVTCPLCKGTVLDDDLLQQQQLVAAQLEASFAGVSSPAALARRRQQQLQVQQLNRGRSSSQSGRRSRSNSATDVSVGSGSGTGAAVAAADIEQGGNMIQRGSSGGYRELLELTSLAMAHVLRGRSLTLAGAASHRQQQQQQQQQPAVSSSDSGTVRSQTADQTAVSSGSEAANSSSMDVDVELGNTSSTTLQRPS